MPKFFNVFPSNFAKIYPSLLPFFSMLTLPLFLFQLFHPNFSCSPNSQTLLPGSHFFHHSLTIAYCSYCHPWLFHRTAQTLFCFPCFQTLNIVSLTASIVHLQHFDASISQISHLNAPSLAPTPLGSHMDAVKGQWKGHGDERSCPRHSSAAASQHPSIPG